MRRCGVMLRLIIALVALLLVVPLQNHTARAQDPCSGLPESRLQSGMTARVILDGDGIGTVIRTAAGKEQSGSEVIRALPEGTILELVNGPVCLDGLLAWEVRLISGESGWVSEADVNGYNLEPFEIGRMVFKSDLTDPLRLNRWYVTFSGDVRAEESVVLPDVPATLARDLWQQPDLDAANAALADRRANCPAVLQGTVWENLASAAELNVPVTSINFVPAPDGDKGLLVLHRTFQIPTCGGSPGVHYGISTVHTLVADGTVIDLFPYGQHGGARERTACQSADVPDLAWLTDLHEVVWSPDSDTVALVVRYLEQADPVRQCAHYYVFMVDVFSGRIDPIGEGRRVGWGSGGARLYYFKLQTDNGYNILFEQLWMLSEGRQTQINLLPEVQFVPRSLNSSGAILPYTEDGRFALACSTLSGCPSTQSFEISTTNPNYSPPVGVPQSLLPFEIVQVHYVAGDTRLLWLTAAGKVFLQGVQGVGIGLVEEISVADVVGNEAVVVVDILPMPTGLSAILVTADGHYVLLNTVNRNMQLLEELTP